MGALVYIDGLAWPNPGLGTYGYVILVDGKKVEEGSGLAGRNVTNNYAEYTALAVALRKLLSLGETRAKVRSDSRLLVGQMSQGWKVKGGGYLPKLKESRELVGRFQSVEFEWVPREQNEEADRLTNVALAKYGA